MRTTTSELKPVISEVEFNKNHLIIGPREKNKATQHFEFIISTYLLNPTAISDKEINVIQIEGYIFKLNELLKYVDYEQLKFSNAELTAYFHKNSSYKDYIKKDGVHPAISIALHKWTSTEYSFYQKILREKTVDFNRLADIAVICYGLNDPIFYSKYSEEAKEHITFRGERRVPHSVRQEREEATEDKRLLRHAGFTATSKDASTACKFAFCCYGTQLAYIQSNAINPIGKSIQIFSQYEGESEVVFPPGSEFIYQTPPSRVSRCCFSYDAYPVRALNNQYDSRGVLQDYKHSFTQDELINIPLTHLHYQYNFFLNELLKALAKRSKKPLLSYLFLGDESDYLQATIFHHDIKSIKEGLAKGVSSLTLKSSLKKSAQILEEYIERKDTLGQLAVKNLQEIVKLLTHVDSLPSFIGPEEREIPAEEVEQMKVKRYFGQ